VQESLNVGYQQKYETVSLPILPVLLCIALASQAQTQTAIPNLVFVQINVVIQGAGAKGNDEIMIDGKGAILRGGGARIRGGAHSRGGAEPPSTLTKPWSKMANN
jgi:hypothetical protein